MEKYEDPHDYCKSTQRFSGDYSCINENEYTEISTVKAASTDCKIEASENTETK